MRRLLFADVYRFLEQRRGGSRRRLVSMVFKAGNMLRFCTFVDLVKCRGLVAAVVGCAETCRAEACCAEAF